MNGPYQTADEALADAWRLRFRPSEAELVGAQYQKLAAHTGGVGLGIFDMVALREVARLDEATVQAIAELLIRRFEQGQQHHLDPDAVLGGFCRTCGKQLTVGEVWRAEQAGHSGQCPECGRD